MILSFKKSKAAEKEIQRDLGIIYNNLNDSKSRVAKIECNKNLK